jgi:hypothetical protein
MSNMQVSNRITMRGGLSTVYDFAAQVERWPEILPHYRRVKILEPGERERLVSMHCVRAFGPVNWPCKWRARQELRPEDGHIRFIHVSGPARGMRVDWELVETAGGVQTTITHWGALNRSGLARFYWNRIVGPVFVESIAQRTLQTIKTLVEGKVAA